MQSISYRSCLQDRPSSRSLLRILRVMLAVAVFVGGLAWSPITRADDGVHVVANGESLGFIARRYNISVNELVAGNGLVNPNVIVSYRGNG